MTRSEDEARFEGLWGLHQDVNRFTRFPAVVDGLTKARRRLAVHATGNELFEGIVGNHGDVVALKRLQLDAARRSGVDVQALEETLRGLEHQQAELQSTDQSQSLQHFSSAPFWHGFWLS